MQLRKLVFAALAGVVLAAAGRSAAAQDTTMAPLPASEFYFDEEPRTTRPVVAIDGSGDPLAQKLLREIQRNPRARAETAQLAHMAMAGGRPQVGRELYGRAIAQLDINNALYRPVLWNYGWDLYRLGEYEAALAQWNLLLESRRVDAEWMPPTFALALWKLDRKAEAVQWYAAAVRTRPDRWRVRDQFSGLLPDWRDEDRAILAEVQQAWQADPPGWG
ncbi:tetratricopeptide repeat protein [Lysobacter sp. F6437]|uniref:tetratricopeptide repeat protein n=1 Tax=Lysobacter sp. F6437 TaxID=3459296 RepID=UPI00403DFC95